MLSTMPICCKSQHTLVFIAWLHLIHVLDTLHMQAIEEIARACKLPYLLLCSTDDPDVKATWRALGFLFSSDEVPHLQLQRLPAWTYLQHPEFSCHAMTPHFARTSRFELPRSSEKAQVTVAGPSRCAHGHVTGFVCDTRKKVSDGSVVEPSTQLCATVLAETGIQGLTQGDACKCRTCKSWGSRRGTCCTWTTQCRCTSRCRPHASGIRWFSHTSTGGSASTGCPQRRLASGSGSRAKPRRSQSRSRPSGPPRRLWPRRGLSRPTAKWPALDNSGFGCGVQNCPR